VNFVTKRIPAHETSHPDFFPPLLLQHNFFFSNHGRGLREHQCHGQCDLGLHPRQRWHADVCGSVSDTGCGVECSRFIVTGVGCSEQEWEAAIRGECGSNEITSFRVNAGALTFVQKVSSGGTFPVSVAIFGNLLYVLNAHGTSNITAFRVGTTGTMTPIANSTRNLSTALPKPAQVGFSPNGKVLVVAEISTNKIDTFTVAANGLATGPRVQNSAGPGPFGFAFDTAGHLIVSEVTNSSTSSYSVAATGKLTPITRALIDFGKA